MTGWPTEIKLREGGRSLTITFESGAQYDISAELLRVESPSAEVKGHGPGQETLQWGKRDVAVTKLEPVGNYAIRPTFSDGHTLLNWVRIKRPFFRPILINFLLRAFDGDCLIIRLQINCGH
jgi:DUF971 family protein